MAPPYDVNLITNLAPNLGCNSACEVTTSTFGVVTPRITGFISVFCSLLIIYLILRSPTRLSSSYHRIMFGISLFDVFGSTAMGLTTLPMPRDDPVVNHYGFNGTRLGNFETCTTQGFFWTLGIWGTYLYTLMLFAYYFCSIGLLLKTRWIVRYIEPIMHVTAIVTSLSAAIWPLFFQLYNPSSNDPWCTFYPLRGDLIEYKSDGTEYKTSIDIRGDLGQDELSKVISKISYFLASFIGLDIFFLIFICGAVWIRNKRTSYQEQNTDGGTSIQNDAPIHDHLAKETKVVLIQVFCYLLAMLLTVIFPCLPLLYFGGDIPDDGIFRKLTTVFAPLQGFFNFLIFVSFKIVLFRMIDPGLTVAKALSQMFRKPKRDPFILTSLDIVDNDRRIENERMKIIEARDRHRRERGLDSSDDGTNSKTPSRADTIDNWDNFRIRDNTADKNGIRRVGIILSGTVEVIDLHSGQHHSGAILEESPTAGNANKEDIGLNDTGLLKEDELLTTRTSHHNPFQTPKSSQVSSDMSNSLGGILNVSDPHSQDGETLTRQQKLEAQSTTNENCNDPSNNTAGGNQGMSSRVNIYNENVEMRFAAYPKSSQASADLSNSLGGFSMISDPYSQNDGTSTQ